MDAHLRAIAPASATGRTSRSPHDRDGQPHAAAAAAVGRSARRRSARDTSARNARRAGRVQCSTIARSFARSMVSTRGERRRAGTSAARSSRAAERTRLAARARGRRAKRSISSTTRGVAATSRPCGRMNAWMNRRALCALRAVRRPAAAPAAPTCSSSVGGQVQQPALDVLEMLEVQRAFLRRGELLGLHRIDRPADDARLDHRARVDADDGLGVVHRVEVVGARAPPIGLTPAFGQNATLLELGGQIHALATARAFCGCGRTSTPAARSRGSRAGRESPRSTGARTRLRTGR